VVIVSALRDLGTVTVSVPARKVFVHVLRSVAASVASRMPMSIDDVDDLRLAVDEAAARLLLLAGVGRLSLSLRHAVEGLDVVLTAPGATGTWPEPDLAGTLTWKILTALTESVRFERTVDGPEIRMLKRANEVVGA
jgi:serine/threonine-protein kinase RsbW